MTTLVPLLAAGALGLLAWTVLAVPAAVVLGRYLRTRQPPAPEDRLT